MSPHSLQATASAVPTALLTVLAEVVTEDHYSCSSMQWTTPSLPCWHFHSTADHTTHLSCLCFSDFSHICARYSSAPLWFSPHFHKESVVRPSSQFARVCQMIVLPLKISCTLLLLRFTCSHAFSSIPTVTYPCLLSVSTQMPHTHLNHSMANNLIIIFPKWFCLGLLRCLCHCQIISGTHLATLLTSSHPWLQFQRPMLPSSLCRDYKHMMHTHVGRTPHTKKKMSLVSTSHRS